MDGGDEEEVEGWGLLGVIEELMEGRWLVALYLAFGEVPGNGGYRDRGLGSSVVH